MCTTLDDERPCRCPEPEPSRRPEDFGATRRRLEARATAALNLPPQVTATLVAIPTTHEPARRPALPFVGSPLIDPQRHWGVSTSQEVALAHRYGVHNPTSPSAHRWCPCGDDQVPLQDMVFEPTNPETVPEDRRAMRLGD